jgi:phenylpropionate dioxygenase-like ring-hydroxylating dioxygenase large terminal subunit
MGLLSEDALVARVLEHIDAGTTDLAADVHHVPVDHYASPERLSAELSRAFRRTATPFCPSCALPEAGSFVAREAAGVPLVATRGTDGVARVFLNACRHRGMQVAEGSGCKKVLTCRYHAWTYGLDGALRGVPDEHGFPGLDKGAHGLVPVKAVEQDGLIYVTLEGEAGPDPALGEMSGLLGKDSRLVDHNSIEMDANWKLICEGFLEGYHIRATHPETFYPRQYDNLNVIEAWGRGNRVTFPYQAVEKQRAFPPGQRRAGGGMTSVWHIFPNVVISTFPKTRKITIVEPLGPARSRLETFVVTDAPQTEEDTRLVDISRDFVAAGAAEDRMVVSAVQKGLASGANAVLTFGLFEGALTHLHREVEAAISA